MSRRTTTRETYKEIILNILDWKCENCGKMGNLDELRIHHKDKNPQNNSVDNIQILCSKCYSDTYRKFPKKYFGPWSDLMRSDYPVPTICSMKKTLKKWIKEMSMEEVLKKVRSKKAKRVRYFYMGHLFKWGLIDRNDNIISKEIK